MRTHKVSSLESAYTWCDRPVWRVHVVTDGASVTCLTCLGKIGDQIRAEATRHASSLSSGPLRARLRRVP